jgi:hypothetical protein
MSLSRAGAGNLGGNRFPYSLPHFQSLPCCQLLLSSLKLNHRTLCENREYVVNLKLERILPPLLQMRATGTSIVAWLRPDIIQK